jgi:hypothetical protein
MDDWDISDEMMAALRGERITVTFNVAELVPGTYVYLDADDEIIAVGVLNDDDDNDRWIPPAPNNDDDDNRRVPPALDEFPDDGDDDQRRGVPPIWEGLPEDVDDNMAPCDRTVVGPLMRPRTPAPRPIHDYRNEPNRGTFVGPPMKPRRPAPRKK